MLKITRTVRPIAKIHQAVVGQDRLYKKKQETVDLIRDILWREDVECEEQEALGELFFGTYVLEWQIGNEKHSLTLAFGLSLKNLYSFPHNDIELVNDSELQALRVYLEQFLDVVVTSVDEEGAYYVEGYKDLGNDVVFWASSHY